ncbi:MAG: amino acid ABC transporter substrate-binding protein, partial [Variovorax sp.]
MRNPRPSFFGATDDGGLDRRTFLQAAAALGAGLSMPSAFSQAGQPLDIGWIRPTTGRLVSTFQPLYVGGVIAVDEINAAGGILGRPLVRVEEDDEASPAKQPAVAKKLLDRKPLAFVGPTGSSQALASLAFTTRAKMPQATYANAAELADGTKYPYHYQLSFNTAIQAEVIVRHLVEKLGLRKIGVIQENTAFGEQGTAST